MSDLMVTILFVYSVGALFTFLLLLVAFTSVVDDYPLHERPKQRARRILLMLGAVFVVPLIWPLVVIWLTGEALVGLLVVAFGKED